MSGWLDLPFGVRDVLKDGEQQPAQPAINLLPPFSAADDPINGRTDVSIDPASDIAAGLVPLTDGEGKILVVGSDNRPQWIHGVPRTRKYELSYSDFSAAALTGSAIVFALPAKGMINNVTIQPTVSFSGGSITAYEISVGVAAEVSRYAAAFDVFQAVGDAVGAVYDTGPGLESFGASTNINAYATATGDNLDQASAGRVSIFINWLQLP